MSVRTCNGGVALIPHVGPPPLCPAFGATELNDLHDGTWDCNFTWAPDVLAVTFIVQWSADGAVWNNILDLGPTHSGTGTNISPTDYVSIGDTLYIRAQASDIVGCGDFICNPEHMVVTS